MKATSVVKRAFKKYFLIGLIVLVPFLVTWKFFLFVVDYLDQILAIRNGRFLYVIPEALHPDHLLGFHLPGLGVIFSVVLILLVGMLSRLYLGNKLIKMVDAVVGRIPLARIIYNVVKQVLETYAERKSQQFTKVVVIEYPRLGLHTLAFVTGVAVGTLQNLKEEKLLNVFVPTTPNPTSGFYLMVPEKDTVELKISIEDAFKLLVSGGFITPETIRQGTSVDVQS